ncbi:universal stress protein [Dactylosporangium sp. NPDC005555]|uniref:universal stress protein n=1 Tax=Dactylosporangium sp. NPDC005555 TaxID=3154889 RepID=UPI0033A7D05D
MAGWRERYPGVKVEALVAAGRAAKVLIGMSHTAQLVVVGSRGHGGFAGLLLGSVGRQLMHYAECPVLIAHAPAAGRNGEGPAAAGPSPLGVAPR